MTVAQQIAAPAGAGTQDRAGFQIIPRRGLIVVALVLAGLVTVVATNTAWGVDFFHVPDGQVIARLMAVLVATLAVFAVDVPVILAFTVARFQDPGQARGG
jgi:hypothetical protein